MEKETTSSVNITKFSYQHVTVCTGYSEDSIIAVTMKGLYSQQVVSKERIYMY